MPPRTWGWNRGSRRRLVRLLRARALLLDLAQAALDAPPVGVDEELDKQKLKRRGASTGGMGQAVSVRNGRSIDARGMRSCEAHHAAGPAEAA